MEHNRADATCSQSAMSVLSLLTCLTRSWSTATAWPGCRDAFVHKVSAWKAGVMPRAYQHGWILLPLELHGESRGS